MGISLSAISNEYTRHAAAFLERHGLTFTVQYIGEDCPRFCDDARRNQHMEQIGRFPRTHHIHGSHFRLTLARKDASAAAPAPATAQPLTVDFWDSFRDAEVRYIRKTRGETLCRTMAQRHGLEIGMGGFVSGASIQRKLPRDPKPTAYDLLTCIQKYDPGTFANFCGDYGYDTDSRTAMDVYQAVAEEYQRVARFFSAAELEEAREIV